MGVIAGLKSVEDFANEAREKSEQKNR